MGGMISEWMLRRVLFGPSLDEKRWCIGWMLLPDFLHEYACHMTPPQDLDEGIEKLLGGGIWIVSGGRG